MNDKIYRKEMIINGLPVTAEYDYEDIDAVFIPLLKRLTQLQRKKNRRIIVYLAAPPGLGKSTLVKFLENLSNETAGVTPMQAAGMDGFHHYASYLKSHTTIRDGEEILLNSIKGAPDTFDAERLARYIRRLTEEPDILWPDYDRTLHDVVDDGYILSGDIILLEGNYLLLSDKRWSVLREYADYTIYAYTDFTPLRSRLINRRILGGYEHDDSARFVDYSDGRNVELVLRDRPAADLTLHYSDGRWLITD